MSPEPTPWPALGSQSALERRSGSANPLERLNNENQTPIARCRDPSPTPLRPSAWWGPIFTNTHDEWQATGRRYLSEDFMVQLDARNTTLATTEPTVGK